MHGTHEFLFTFLQLGLFLKKILKDDLGSRSTSEFLETISRYLSQRTSLVSNDLSTFCKCGGKHEIVRHIVSHSSEHAETINIHQKQLQVKITCSIL